MPSVRIYEVSPRDGLQNEVAVVETSQKIELIERLVASGLRDIEVTSFVRPSWIPQLSDATAVIARLPRAEGVNFWSLVPNQRGLERAVDAGVTHIGTFISASETHNKKNLNRTQAESLASLRNVMAVAQDEGMGIRAYISTVFGCPFEGPVPIERTVALSHALLEAGADEIALGDTTGMGDPRLVEAVLGALTKSGVSLDRIALHMHDTRGSALANVLAGYEFGVRSFDGSVAGVGGCPYAPGAAGNAATDDLVHMFEAMGVDTGVDLDTLAESGVFLGGALGRELPGRYHRYHIGTSGRATSQTA
jgi:hydroxymethylglutaryl-CoA lyase